jgi:hypothetical protein
LQKYNKQLKEIQQIEDRMASLIVKLQDYKDGKTTLPKGESPGKLLQQIQALEKQL